METNKSKFDKFFINIKVRNIVIILSGVMAILYIVTLLFINSIDATGLGYQILLLFKDLLVVAFSIVTTTILTAWFVEVNSRNKMYGDIICNDFLASEEFYKTLTAENRESILCNLEKQNYFEGNSVKENMYRSITKKLQNMDSDFYYTDCRYTITCDVNNNMITNNIKKTLKIRSYKPSLELEKFRLARSVYAHIDGIKNLELLKLKIDKKEASVDEKDEQIKYVKDNEINEQMKSCGYDTMLQVYCVEPIKLSSEKDYVVEMEYRTIVDVKDTVFSYRMAKPCEKFSLEFRLKNGSAQSYALNSCAFGFADDAIRSVHSSSRDVVNVNFNDWIYVSDGVVVTITKK